MVNVVVVNGIMKKKKLYPVEYTLSYTLLQVFDSIFWIFITFPSAGARIEFSFCGTFRLGSRKKKQKLEAMIRQAPNKNHWPNTKKRTASPTKGIIKVKPSLATFMP